MLQRRKGGVKNKCQVESQDYSSKSRNQALQNFAHTIKLRFFRAKKPIKLFVNPLKPLCYDNYWKAKTLSFPVITKNIVLVYVSVLKSYFYV